MTESDMVWLRELRDAAEDALRKNITAEQTERLKRIINRIDEELLKADSREWSRLRRSTRPNI